MHTNKLLRKIFFSLAVTIISSQLKAMDPFANITQQLMILIKTLKTTNNQLDSSTNQFSEIFNSDWHLTNQYWSDTNQLLEKVTSFSYLAKASCVIFSCAYLSYQGFQLAKHYLLEYYKKCRNPSDDHLLQLN